MLQALSGHTCAVIREAHDLDDLIEGNGEDGLHAVRAKTLIGIRAKPLHHAAPESAADPGGA
jgi:hypothetical protein